MTMPVADDEAGDAAAAEHGRRPAPPCRRAAWRPRRTTTTDEQDRVDRPGPLGAEPGRHRIDARRRVALDVRPGIGDGQRGAGDARRPGRGSRTDDGSAAGRPEPAEDRQERDPDREREPRPGRALEARGRRRSRSRGRRPPGRRSAARTARRAPARATAPPTTTTAQRLGGETRPAGIGLPGLRPASRGASTMSLSDPIETWRAVIDDARGGPRSPRRRRRSGATAATTTPSSRRRERDGSAGPGRRVDGRSGPRDRAAAPRQT